MNYKTGEKEDRGVYRSPGPGRLPESKPSTSGERGRCGIVRLSDPPEKSKKK